MSADPAPGEPVCWLLDAGRTGAALTQTGALSRALVRDAALRWPNWWRAELFGPPHREAELPMLTELRGRLVALRLLRRRGRALHTTKRGLALVDTSDELRPLLRDDMASGSDIETTSWWLLSELLLAAGPNGVTMEEIEHELLDVLDDAGWRVLGGEQLNRDDLWHVLQPLRLRGEAYGLMASNRLRAGTGWRLRSTDVELRPQ